MSIMEIYMLNLILTVAMFIVLIFRAWIELKNFRLIWRELEWRRTREAIAQILPSEKELFVMTEEGRELYKLLCKIFEIKEQE